MRVFELMLRLEVKIDKVNKLLKTWIK